MQFISYHLDYNSKEPLYIQLYKHIKNDIHQQKLLIGEKLPSKRILADRLKVSKSTIENAYNQLISEGYIEAINKVGYFVAFQANHNYVIPQQKQKLTKNNFKQATFLDLTSANIDCENFPFATWRKYTKNLINKSAQLLLLGDKQGEYALRVEISKYLYACRGVNCAPEQIIITSGIDYALLQLVLLLDKYYQDNKLQYAIEENAYAVISQVLQLCNKAITFMPTNIHKNNLDLDFLTDQKINILYLTPSHQYPFGQVLPISQRQKLIDWLNAEPLRYIIEDDYDSELRLKGKPIPSLKNLDHQDKIIYCGSFSKLLFPALRISYMVLPTHLLSALQLTTCSVPRLEQLVLTQFIREGDFDRHLNKMRRTYNRKNELICAVLDQHANIVKYYKDHTGFNVLIEILNAKDSLAELQTKFHQAKIKVDFLLVQQKILINLGFGNLPEQQLTTVVNLIIQLIQD